MQDTIATSFNTLSRNSKKPILKTGMGFIFCVALFTPKLWKSAFGFAFVALKKFFLNQYKYNRLRKKNKLDIPVRNVEHPLDKTIPIDYSKISDYKTFVSMWIRACSYFRKAIGKSFNKPFASFMDGLSLAYNDASSIYGSCLSTTKRPKKAPSFGLKIVYTFDPHLFCVPSLHVIVVCYTYWRLNEILEELGVEHEFHDEINQLRDHAIKVIDSVLFVRQHSVNCIPAAFSLLGVILPSFDKTETISIINSLFSDCGLLENERNDVISYMISLYEKLVSVGKNKSNRYNAIIDFIKNY